MKLSKVQDKCQRHLIFVLIKDIMIYYMLIYSVYLKKEKIIVVIFGKRILSILIWLKCLDCQDKPYQQDLKILFN